MQKLFEFSCKILLNLEISVFCYLNINRKYGSVGAGKCEYLLGIKWACSQNGNRKDTLEKPMSDLWWVIFFVHSCILSK